MLLLRVPLGGIHYCRCRELRIHWYEFHVVIEHVED